ncbi:MAG: hypothetical protein WKF37_22315 [Bryobacteraceae bacterium]
MKATLAKIPKVKAEIFVPQIANQCPHVRASLDGLTITSAELMQKLRDGEPSIELVPAPSVPNTIEIASWMLQPGDADVITRRIREILTKGAV